MGDALTWPMGSNKGNDVGKLTEQLAKQYYDQTDPLRQGLISNFMNFLGTPSGSTPGGQPIYETTKILNPQWDRSFETWDSGIPQYINKKNITGYTQPSESEPGMPYDVTRNPVWGASRGVLENQYNVARDQALSNLPAGGALMDQLTNIDTARAQGLSDLAANISQDEYNKLYGMATGAPQTSLGTLSNIAGQQAMANAQEQAGKYGALGDIGAGAGMMLGMKA